MPVDFFWYKSAKSQIFNPHLPNVKKATAKMEGKRAKPGADYNNFCLGRKPVWLCRKKDLTVHQFRERGFMVCTIHIIDNPALAPLRFINQYSAGAVCFF